MSGDHNQYQKDKSYLDFECPRCGHCCQALEEKQEPVAWRSTSPDGKLSNKFACKPTESNWVEPLYTAPSKREWVGLTALEIYECWKTGDVVSAVEAKLKEKNMKIFGVEE